MSNTSNVSNIPSHEDVRAYWEDPNTRSIIDKHLHSLETSAILAQLNEQDSVLEVGFGDGTATKIYAALVRELVGIEQSKYLFEQAEAILKDEHNVRLFNMPYSWPRAAQCIVKNNVNVIISQRFLVNLPSWQEQANTIKGFFDLLPVGGLLIMSECFYESWEYMNELRARASLPSIAKHWHNTYLREDMLRAVLKFDAEIVDVRSFDLYIFLTRIYGQKIGNFTGYGVNAVKDPIMDRIDMAAYLISQKEYLPNIKFDKPVGPIQVWTIRKTA